MHASSFAGDQPDRILVQLSALVCSALVQVGIHYGLGQHLMEISNEYDRIEAFKYTVIAPNFSIVSTTTGKISVVIFLLRLMGQAATKPKKYFLYGLTVLSIILNTMCIIILIGFCIPAKKIWIPSTPGHCMSLQTQLVIGETQACKRRQAHPRIRRVVY